MNLTPAKGRVQGCLGLFHQRGMESAADLQGDDSFGPPLERGTARLLYPCQRPRHDDLAGGVVVRDPRLFGFFAGLSDASQVEAQYRGHGPGLRLGGRLHRLTSGLHEPGAHPSLQRSSGHQRRVLAEAMTCDCSEGVIARLARFEMVEWPSEGGVQDHEAEGVGRQLGVTCGPERVAAGIQEQLGDIAAHDLAQLRDELPGRVATPRRPHARTLRSLPREDKHQHESRMLRP